MMCATLVRTGARHVDQLLRSSTSATTASAAAWGWWRRCGLRAARPAWVIFQTFIGVVWSQIAADELRLQQVLDRLFPRRNIRVGNRLQHIVVFIGSLRDLGGAAFLGRFTIGSADRRITGRTFTRTTASTTTNATTLVGGATFVGRILRTFRRNSFAHSGVIRNSRGDEIGRLTVRGQGIAQIKRGSLVAIRWRGTRLRTRLTTAATTATRTQCVIVLVQRYDIRGRDHFIRLARFVGRRKPRCLDNAADGCRLHVRIFVGPNELILNRPIR